MNATKICSCCHRERLLSEFYRHKNGKFGVQGRCKECSRTIQMEEYNRNPEKYRGLVRKYRRKNPQICRDAVKKYKASHPARMLLDNCRHRAKIKNIPCNLTMEDIIVPEVCPVLGIKLEYSKGKYKDNSPSVDRIIPMKGYIRGNVAIVSHKINRIKGHLSISEVESLLKYMKEKSLTVGESMVK